MSWSSTDESVLVSKLLKAKDNILATDSGFKCEAWVEVEKALQGRETKSGGALKTVEQCKTYWAKLKKDYGDATLTDLDTESEDNTMENKPIPMSCKSSAT
ncbi:hypothetical protein BKA82DRAFT_4009805 [Pisolithus tinctorius]|nr:hypothetical protein BKA82DRAFT_4009805 [Pisolithus tinctorius]